MKVILDGEYVEHLIITPKLHKFIGTWRSSSPIGAYYAGATVMHCCSVCGSCGSIENCWRLGHQDLPQYVTIKE